MLNLLNVRFWEIVIAFIPLLHKGTFSQNDRILCHQSNSIQVITIYQQSHQRHFKAIRARPHWKPFLALFTDKSVTLCTLYGEPKTASAFIAFRVSHNEHIRRHVRHGKEQEKASNVARPLFFKNINSKSGLVYSISHMVW